MTLPQKTEAKHLRSICHYGNKVARPFFSFPIFTAGSLSYANEAADEAFLLGGPCWDQLHQGDLLPACLNSRQDSGCGDPQRWLPEQHPQLETRLPLAPSNAPDSFWYAEVLKLQRPQLSVPQDLGLYFRLTNI